MQRIIYMTLYIICNAICNATIAIDYAFILRGMSGWNVADTQWTRTENPKIQESLLC